MENVFLMIKVDFFQSNGIIQKLVELKIVKKTNLFALQKLGGSL